MIFEEIIIESIEADNSVLTQCPLIKFTQTRIEVLLYIYSLQNRIPLTSKKNDIRKM
jgi:hypothetical protein